VSKASAVLYKPLGFGVGMLGGLAASAVVKRVWKRASGADDAPTPTNRSDGWREILLAAAVQGAIYGVVKAAVNRGGAVGVRRLTGTWPGK
jgi:hypothetical protein